MYGGEAGREAFLCRPRIMKMNEAAGIIYNLCIVKNRDDGRQA